MIPTIRQGKITIDWEILGVVGITQELCEEIRYIPGTIDSLNFFIHMFLFAFSCSNFFINERRVPSRFFMIGGPRGM